MTETKCTFRPKRRIHPVPQLLIIITLLATSNALVPPLKTGTSIKPRDLPDSVWETIQQGKIAVVDNFLPASQITQLRRDAQAIYYNDQKFITNAIAGYSAAAQPASQHKIQFDPAKDRSVCPAYIPSQQTLGPFVNPQVGTAPVLRINTLMQTQIARLRHDLAVGLDRPGLAQLPDGPRGHEISYTRFGPGAFLQRHTDEHHEECKGPAGWLQPTRRSLSWLIYLNEPDWQPDRDGGCLRTYPRQAPTSRPTGARQGDLQVGWLTATQGDPRDRPVFLDARRHGVSGQCALYMDDTSSSGDRRYYLTKDFPADPYLFMSTDWVLQHVLIQNYKAWGHRFHYVEAPKSVVTDFWERQQKKYRKGDAGPSYYDAHGGEYMLDVPPTGGTLVMFDSVTLPHQVLPTIGRERWAVSGWFHEKQQALPPQEQALLSVM